MTFERTDRNYEARMVRLRNWDSRLRPVHVTMNCKVRVCGCRAQYVHRATLKAVVDPLIRCRHDVHCRFAMSFRVSLERCVVAEGAVID